MGISTPGQALPTNPPAVDLSTVLFFDDFMYSSGAATQEIVYNASVSLSNLNGVEQGHPGVITCRLDQFTTATLVIMSNAGGAQWLQYDVFNSFTLEWLFKITGVGANGITLFMGTQQTNACGGVNSSCGLGFRSQNSVSCTNFTADDSFFFLTNDGTTNRATNLAVSVSGLFGTWVKASLTWNKTAGSIVPAINGTSFGPFTQNIPASVLTGCLFGVGVANLSGTPAGPNYLLLDYVKFTGNVTRS